VDLPPKNPFSGRMTRKNHVENQEKPMEKPWKMMVEHG